MCFVCSLGVPGIEHDSTVAPTPESLSQGIRSTTWLGYDSDLNDSDQITDALSNGRQWNVSTDKNLTYSFPDEAADIT